MTGVTVSVVTIACSTCVSLIGVASGESGASAAGAARGETGCAARSTVAVGAVISMTGATAGSIVGVWVGDSAGGAGAATWVNGAKERAGIAVGVGKGGGSLLHAAKKIRDTQHRRHLRTKQFIINPYRFLSRAIRRLLAESRSCATIQASDCDGQTNTFRSQSNHSLYFALFDPQGFSQIKNSWSQNNRSIVYNMNAC